jgi:hypothetical protein
MAEMLGGVAADMLRSMKGKSPEFGERSEEEGGEGG